MIKKFTDNILISATNWLGDSIMSMPAIQVFKRRNPDCAVCLLVKNNLIPLWELHESVDFILQLDEGLEGTYATALRIRRMAYTKAFILSNSIRSALVPALAGVSPRIGMPGHSRSWLLSNVIPDGELHADCHQSQEYADIMGMDRAEVEAEPPRISIPPAAAQSAFLKAGIKSGDRYIVIMPGAAYGPVKQWPPEHFTETAKMLIHDHNCRALVLGSKKESELCARVASCIGLQAISVAGLTSLPELAALLSNSLSVISNDSGGMHLASACGAKLVAVFGITDPVKTGPLGKNCRVMTAKGVKGRREIRKDDPNAVSVLRSITPHSVIDAAKELIEQGSAK